jgi:16S rRNA (guanine(527)-N(7))-methyltransferase RsmG
MSSPRAEFIKAIELHQSAFGLDLNEDVKGRLADHFDLVIEQNPVLHLTGPSTPEEFAVRHVLESLIMLEFLPTGARFADIGSGAGFPALPCLIVRDDLRGVLIESKEKKAGFLRAAIDQCGLGRQAEVISKQFSETPRPDVSYISCRALDRFTQHLPKLLKWSGNKTLLFFGGPALRDEMQRLGLDFEERLMPMSDQRFLFASPPRTDG